MKRKTNIKFNQLKLDHIQRNELNSKIDFQKHSSI